MSDFDFYELVGEELDFYGAVGNVFKVGEYVCEAIEDNGSDHGSRLDVVLAENPGPSFGLPLARVIVENDDDGRDLIYKLVDLHDEHCWLRFGTQIYNTSERSYDILPVFEYSPKPPQEP